MNWVQGVRGNNKSSNICRLESQSQQRGSATKDSIQRNNSENMPSVMDLQDSEGEQTPRTINPNKYIPKYILTRFLKTKQKPKSWKKIVRNGR